MFCSSCYVFHGAGDGFISLRELKWVMTNMGERMSDEEVKVMLQQADTNGDGKIDYDGMQGRIDHTIVS